MDNNWLQIAMYLGTMLGMAAVVFWNNRSNKSLITKVSKSTDSVALALSGQEKPPKAEDISTPIKEDLKATIAGFFESTLPIIQEQSTKIAELTVNGNQLKQDFLTYRTATDKELDDLRCRLSAKENELTSAQETIKTQESKLQEIVELKRRVEQLEQDVAMLKSERDALTKERDEAVARAVKAETENRDLKKKLSDTEVTLARAEAELLKRPPAPEATKPEVNGASR